MPPMRARAPRRAARRWSTRFKGLRLESPRGPIAIDAGTRDIVQTVYIRRTAKRASDGRWVNVELAPRS